MFSPRGQLSRMESLNSDSTAEQKVTENMSELSKMLDSFLDELYGLIEDFLRDSRHITRNENPDLAALFLAKQEKQIRNLMQGEEAHLQKRFEDITNKTKERALKMKERIDVKADQ